MTSFDVHVSFQGRLIPLENITTTTTCAQLVQRVQEALRLDDADMLKILCKGKNLVQQPPNTVVFTEAPRKPPKLLVTAPSREMVQEIQSKRSDPTIRGFDNPSASSDLKNKNPFWGTTGQDRNYKFVRLVACTSFQNNASFQVHTFEAQRLLEKLSTDPGVVAVMKERQLVVNTLGEMDPVDDRLLQKKQAQGVCLLGYNTNHGLRIDVRLRSQDLATFLPYASIVATLVHEISHNWFGEHNLYFWTNYGQMRAEYLSTHYCNTVLWQGKTSAQIADLPPCADISAMILQELQQEMAQHGLHPNMIASAIQERCRELQESSTSRGDNKLGGNSTTNGKTARELALEAAERRAQKKQGDKEQE
jgi:hypothetical protein